MKTVPIDTSFADQILAIYNDAILNSTVVYEYKLRTPAVIAAWFEAKAKGNYPIMGVVAEDGELMGFGTYGQFRPFPGYKYTVEHSVYVAKKFRGHGIGKYLLGEIITAARGQNYHALIGVIDSKNAVSIALHKKFGFQHAGTIRQAGFKFGQWLDVDFYQFLLETPAKPVDG